MFSFLFMQRAHLTILRQIMLGMYKYQQYLEFNILTLSPFSQIYIRNIVQVNPAHDDSDVFDRINS